MNQILEIGWTWHPSVVIGFSLWTILYVALIIQSSKPANIYQQVAFHFGTLVGLIALVSPLDELGDEYLFSAHMVQHLLLMFITAPMWIIGIPGWMVNSIFGPKISVAVRSIGRPLIAFIVFIGVILFWHIPVIYELAQESEALHIFEHLTFIGSGLIGWWPVAGAKGSDIPKPEPPIRMLYLFLLSIPCAALAATLTFSHAPFYQFYVTASHPFGLTALEDQHLGGLLMWLPTHLVILLALVITFLKWFDESEIQADQNLINTLS